MMAISWLMSGQWNCDRQKLESPNLSMVTFADAPATELEKTTYVVQVPALPGQELGAERALADPDLNVQGTEEVRGKAIGWETVTIPAGTYKAMREKFETGLSGRAVRTTSSRLLTGTCPTSTASSGIAIGMFTKERSTRRSVLQTCAALIRSLRHAAVFGADANVGVSVLLNGCRADKRP